MIRRSAVSSFCLYAIYTLLATNAIPSSDRYDKNAFTVVAGEVIPCENHHINLPLGIFACHYNSLTIVILHGVMIAIHDKQVRA
jgi:hypothetical protein